MHKFILKMQQILGSHGRTSCVIFPEFLPACENPFIPSVHSWDKVNFTVQRLNCPHPILTKPNEKIFGQLLIFCDFVSTCKKWGHFINFFWKYSWFKNPSIWFAENLWPKSQEQDFFQHRICTKFREIEWSNSKKRPRLTTGWRNTQMPFHRILLATARCLTSKTAVDWHLKVKNVVVDLSKNYCITVSIQKII